MKTSQPKIKIVDDAELRNQIEEHAEQLNQTDLAKWAIRVAKHVLPYLEKEYPDNQDIQLGIQTNERWQKGEATVHQVRQAGFKVHEVAKACKNETAKAAARSMGQAIGVGHMRGHAIIASDYAIKTINIDFDNDMRKVWEEREWQWRTLCEYIKGR